MKIALVGPSDMRDTLVHFLNKYASYNLVEAEISEFDRLKVALNENWDLMMVYTYDEDYELFVDSSISETTDVVLWSNDSKWARAALRAHTKGFLLMPINESDFVNSMSNCINWSKNAKRFRIVKGKNGRSIRCVEIDYAESLGHNVIFHCRDGNVTYTASLSSFEEILSEGFIRCHRSYLVNLRHIHSANSSTIVMKDGTILPISPIKAHEIQEKISEYASNYCAFVNK